MHQLFGIRNSFFMYKVSTRNIDEITSACCLSDITTRPRHWWWKFESNYWAVHTPLDAEVSNLYLSHWGSQPSQMDPWLVHHCINGGGTLADEGICALSISGFKFRLCNPLNASRVLSHNTESRATLSEIASSSDSNGIEESSVMESLPDEISKTVASGVLSLNKFCRMLLII